MARKNLSLRNARYAKIGLQDLCQYIIAQIGKDISMVEIGVFSGDSTRIFASHFSKVISIDPWKSNYDPTGKDHASNPAMYNMQEVEAAFDRVCEIYQNVEKMKMTSHDAFIILRDQKFHFIYIDALHTYEGVKSDLRLWYSKALNFIGGHDYVSRHHPGVKQAVDEMIGQPDQTFKDSSWIKGVTI